MLVESTANSVALRCNGGLLLLELVDGAELLNRNVWNPGAAQSLN